MFWELFAPLVSFGDEDVSVDVGRGPGLGAPVLGDASAAAASALLCAVGSVGLGVVVIVHSLVPRL